MREKKSIVSFSLFFCSKKNQNFAKILTDFAIRLMTWLICWSQNMCLWKWTPKASYLAILPLPTSRPSHAAIPQKLPVLFRPSCWKATAVEFASFLWGITVMGFSLSPKLGSDLSMLVHRRSMLSQTLVRFPTATQLSLLGQSSAAAFGRRALSRRHSTRFSRHTFERWVQCWLAPMPLPSLRLWIGTRLWGLCWRYRGSP